MISGTIRISEGRLFIVRDDGGRPDIFLHESTARQGGLAPPYENRRVRCEITLDAMGNYAARDVAELSSGIGSSMRASASITNGAGKIVVGTIRRFEGRLFIARDDGTTPDIFLHESIARRGGLTPPYEGQRLRCAITNDGMGNCAALKVTAATAGSVMNSGGPLDAA